LLFFCPTVGLYTGELEETDEGSGQLQALVGVFEAIEW